jgi:hypothetical protein
LFLILGFSFLFSVSALFLFFWSGIVQNWVLSSSSFGRFSWAAFFLQDTTLTEHFEMDLVRGLYEFHLSYKVSKMAEVQFSVERVKKLETFALDPGGT